MVYRRIISFFISIVICFSAVPVCRAEYIGTTSGFWGWFTRNAIQIFDGVFLAEPFIKGIGSLTRGDICLYSEDSYHYADDLLEMDPSVTDEYGRASAKAVCKYCNQVFNCYVSDFEQAYETQVSELPATGVTSSGGLIWQTTWDDYYELPDLSCSTFRINRRNAVISVPHNQDSFVSGNFYNISIVDDHSLLITWNGLYGASPFCIGKNFLRAPISGYYSIPAEFVHSKIDYVEFNAPFSKLLSNSNEFLPLTYCFSGEWISLSDYNPSDISSSSTSSHRNYLYTFPILIQPDDQSIVSNTYTINSRPTSFVGDYGIIGDNGQIAKVDNTSIVNETNNTYTNPCTGTTSTITEWTYDYSDRSYNVTTESGDTVTITYGDENITIQEGDTIYNVYYMVDEDPGGEPGVDPTESPTPETCQHKYTAVTDREATCTFAGQVTYTCSLCGHSYTESIPATGHAWDIKETVQTSYDEEGNLLQQGYTIYKCSVCGEEYKDETGTGPPGSGDGSGSGSGEEGESIWDKLGNLLGTIFGTIIDVISAVLGAILDALIALVEMIGEKLVAVVDLVLSFFDEIPRLFSGFLAFLTAVFPFLPDDIMLLLTFGIAVIVFIGIIKALRR